MLDITVTIASDAAWELMERAKAATVSLAPWFRKTLLPGIATTLRLQFESKGAYLNGTAWAPLSEKAIAARMRRRGGNIWGTSWPLVDRGTLMRSFTEESPGPGKVRMVGDWDVEYGSSVIYAGRQHAYRPIVPDAFPAVIVTAWENSLDSYVAERVKD